MEVLNDGDGTRPTAAYAVGRRSPSHGSYSGVRRLQRRTAAAAARGGSPAPQRAEEVRRLSEPVGSGARRLQRRSSGTGPL